MYDVMEQDTRLTSQFIYFRKDQARVSSQWKTGERFQTPLAPLTLIAEDEVPSALSDMLLVKNRLHIYSPKMREVLASIGVSNIEYQPITLIDKKRGVTWEDYRAANIIGKVACLDVDNSEVKSFADGAGYRVVDEFRLLEDQIKPLPGMKEPPRLFRLAEFIYHVIAHESVKEAFAREGVTGVLFTPTQEYC